MLISGLRRGTYSAIAQVPLSDPKVLLLVPPMSDEAALPVQLRSISLRISLRIPPLCADSCESAVCPYQREGCASFRLDPAKVFTRAHPSLVRPFRLPRLASLLREWEQPRHPFGPLVRGVYLAGCVKSGTRCCCVDGLKITQEKLAMQ